MRQLFQRNSLLIDSFFELEEWLQHVQAESDAFFSSVHSFVKRRKPKEDLNRLVFKVNKESQDKSWSILTDGAERLCSMLTHLQQLFEAQSSLMEKHLKGMKSKTVF